MTPLERLVRVTGDLTPAGRLSETVLDLLGRWTLDPCVRRTLNPDLLPEVDCRHCIAEEILRELLTAVEP